MGCWRKWRGSRKFSGKFCQPGKMLGHCCALRGGGAAHLSLCATKMPKLEGDCQLPPAVLSGLRDQLLMPISFIPCHSYTFSSHAPTVEATTLPNTHPLEIAFWKSLVHCKPTYRTSPRLIELTPLSIPAHVQPATSFILPKR